MKKFGMLFIVGLLGGMVWTGCTPEDEELPVSCKAAPVCAPGTVAVEECPEGLTCTENTICDTTILCAPDTSSGCQAYPSCPEGTVAVEECPEDVTCEEAEMCGNTILCEPSEG